MLYYNKQVWSFKQKALPKTGSALDTLLFGIAEIPPHRRDALCAGVIERPVIEGNSRIKVTIIRSHLALIEKHRLFTAR
jgi:hypothetical protein